VNPGVAGAVEGDADRVFEVAGGDFVVADEAGEDRQAGGVGGSPAIGAEGGRVEVPGGAGVGVPVRLRLGDVGGVVELVEHAAGAVDGEHVAITVAAVAALDGGAGGDRERPGVAFAAVGGVTDGKLSLAGADDGVGEAVGAGGAEVRVQVVAAVGVDVGDVGGRARVAWRLGDVLVPGGLVAERRCARRERGGRIGEDLAGAEARVGADARVRGRGRCPGRHGDSARHHGHQGDSRDRAQGSQTCLSFPPI
jgi:hypothetical protein